MVRPGAPSPDGPEVRHDAVHRFADALGESFPYDPLARVRWAFFTRGGRPAVRTRDSQ